MAARGSARSVRCSLRFGSGCRRFCLSAERRVIAVVTPAPTIRPNGYRHRSTSPSLQRLPVAVARTVSPPLRGLGDELGTAVLAPESVGLPVSLAPPLPCLPMRLPRGFSTISPPDRGSDLRAHLRAPVRYTAAVARSVPRASEHGIQAQRFLTSARAWGRSIWSPALPVCETVAAAAQRHPVRDVQPKVLDLCVLLHMVGVQPEAIDVSVAATLAREVIAHMDRSTPRLVALIGPSVDREAVSPFVHRSRQGRAMFRRLRPAPQRSRDLCSHVRRSRTELPPHTRRRELRAMLGRFGLTRIALGHLLSLLCTRRI